MGHPRNILNMMEDRRKLKGGYKRLYTATDAQIRRECCKAKEQWLDDKCSEVEELIKNNQQSGYEKIKQLTKKPRSGNGHAIRKRDGTVVMSMEEVGKRWREYIAELFDDKVDELGEQIEDCGLGKA